MYVMTVWYILLPFRNIFPVLVCCTKKHLATLPCSPWQRQSWREGNRGRISISTRCPSFFIRHGKKTGARWRRAQVVIASASGTECRGFESSKTDTCRTK
jgi:hypothetical protein